MNLSSLSREQQISAILTASEDAIRSAIGIFRASRRTTKAGPAKKLRPCQKCGALMGARELRQHKCEKTAANTAATENAPETGGAKCN